MHVDRENFLVSFLFFLYANFQKSHGKKTHKKHVPWQNRFKRGGSFEISVTIWHTHQRHMKSFPPITERALTNMPVLPIEFPLAINVIFSDFPARARILIKMFQWIKKKSTGNLKRVSNKIQISIQALIGFTATKYLRPIRALSSYYYITMRSTWLNKVLQNSLAEFKPRHSNLRRRWLWNVLRMMEYFER